MTMERQGMSVSLSRRKDFEDLRGFDRYVDDNDQGSIFPIAARQKRKT